MNAFMNGLKNANNFTLTENGGVTHKSTRSDLLDMFAMGAARLSQKILHMPLSASSISATLVAVRERDASSVCA